MRRGIHDKTQYQIKILVCISTLYICFFIEKREISSRHICTHLKALDLVLGVIDIYYEL